VLSDAEVDLAECRNRYTDARTRAMIEAKRA
jgi:hypothetical protein